MKKLFALLLAMMMIFSLAACGDNETPSGSEGDKPGTSQNGDTSLTLADANENNYTDVTKAVFGLEIKPQDGWTIKKVESLNTNTSLDIVFNVPEGANGKEVMKSYFEACAALSSSIWEAKINSETYQTVKGAQFADFDAFFEAEGSDTGTMTQGEWIYEFGDKDIVFTYSCRMGMVELSFVQHVYGLATE